MREFSQTTTSAESHATAAGVAAVKAPATRAAGLGITPEDVSRYVQLYAANPLFGHHGEWVIADNPYRRPVDQPAAARHDFGRLLKREEAFSSSALAAQRMLFNVCNTSSRVTSGRSWKSSPPSSPRPIRSAPPSRC
ncbi:MAG: hypothetical protein LC800_04930 [Acidobacteria bacterium]|nr:hypothetical protein [Acidobacteriota bacterium]